MRKKVEPKRGVYWSFPPIYQIRTCGGRDVIGRGGEIKVSKKIMLYIRLHCTIEKQEKKESLFLIPNSEQKARRKTSH